MTMDVLQRLLRINLLFYDLLPFARNKDYNFTNEQSKFSRT